MPPVLNAEIVLSCTCVMPLHQVVINHLSSPLNHAMRSSQWNTGCIVHGSENVWVGVLMTRDDKFLDCITLYEYSLQHPQTTLEKVKRSTTVYWTSDVLHKHANYKKSNVQQQQPSYSPFTRPSSAFRGEISNQSECDPMICGTQGRGV